MLPEPVAANAAYAIDRKFIVNGKEISDALALYKNLVGAEEDWKARENCTRRASAVELESWRNGARKLNSAG